MDATIVNHTAALIRAVSARRYCFLMPETQSVRNADALAQDLWEDLATRWVPDPLADVDIRDLLCEPRLDSETVDIVQVPRAPLGERPAPVLAAPALRALRDAVEPARDISDRLLDPLVCGYRTGSVSGSEYSNEYRRFRTISEGLADDNPIVVIADVENFFMSVSSDVLSIPMYQLLGDAWEPIADFLGNVGRLGVTGIPAGYGDARLIANLVLAPVDSSIRFPFTRWVDDYRVFVHSVPEAHQVLDELRSALGRMGLELNTQKVQILESSTYLRQRHGRPLDSVYHPQDEESSTVRANLRSAFLQAITDGDRRVLRFALPRLGEQADDFAVEYAFAALGESSIDAPRLVYYLSRFLRDARVAHKVEGLLWHPLSAWTLMRISPLLARVPISKDAIANLVRILEQTESPSLWGTMLRVLSAQRSSAAERVLHMNRILNARAAIAAYRDLEMDVPGVLKIRAPITAGVVSRLDAIPLPRVDSLL